MEEAQFFCPAILVEDIQEAIEQFRDVLGFQIPKSGPYSTYSELEEPGSHKLDFVFMEKKGRFIELVQPKDGPRLETLKKGGPGPYLIDFTVRNIGEAFDYFSGKGLELLDPIGNPIPADKYHQSSTGEKCLYFYLAGVYVEVEEVDE